MHSFEGGHGQISTVSQDLLSNYKTVNHGGETATALPWYKLYCSGTEALTPIRCRLPTSTAAPTHAHLFTSQKAIRSFIGRDKCRSDIPPGFNGALGNH